MHLAQSIVKILTIIHLEDIIYNTISAQVTIQHNTHMHSCNNRCIGHVTDHDTCTVMCHIAYSGETREEKTFAVPWLPRKGFSYELLLLLQLELFRAHTVPLALMLHLRVCDNCQQYHEYAAEQVWLIGVVNKNT